MSIRPAAQLSLHISSVRFTQLLVPRLSYDGQEKEVNAGMMSLAMTRRSLRHGLTRQAAQHTRSSGDVQRQTRG